MILTDEEIMEIRALKDGRPYGTFELCRAIEAATLAKLDELQRQEPVAHQFQTEIDKKWHNFIDDEHYHHTVDDGRWPIRALYAAPKALEPLTDDVIWKNDALMSANSGYGATFETLREIIRAVEAAHGITKGTP